MYVPSPADTSEIVLDKDIEDLIEKLAENVHEVWAKSRIDEGWTYGEERNDSLKQTPCLVPYDELSETEKDYDRHTAAESIKMIIKLGYRIERQD